MVAGSRRAERNIFSRFLFFLAHQKRLDRPRRIYDYPKDLSDHRPLSLPKPSDNYIESIPTTFKTVEFQRDDGKDGWKGQAGRIRCESLRRFLEACRDRGGEMARRLHREWTERMEYLVGGGCRIWRRYRYGGRRKTAKNDKDVRGTQRAVEERARLLRIRAHVPEIASEERLSRPITALRLGNGELTHDIDVALDPRRRISSASNHIEPRDPERVDRLRDETPRADQGGTDLATTARSDPLFLHRLSEAQIDLSSNPSPRTRSWPRSDDAPGEIAGPSGVPYELYQTATGGVVQGTRFVKDRRSADTALHLRLLIEELGARRTEFPAAALFVS
ncbi:BZ3500_MvSof-1268-A1-R1_C050g00190 [Microbotryum saponariae]|uniref:BZ3500_MvSof-1268-A1-R1_C050g00190 protein n=1 Tax=Microbotryum saponariae TaxID=289078 RepID=A0A2X0KT95_9BASI|nr:BZ3500_MvSof-1268-A1-R1_C050g00190 [Microbotryum saponariae]